MVIYKFEKLEYGNLTIESFDIQEQQWIVFLMPPNVELHSFILISLLRITNFLVPPIISIDNKDIHRSVLLNEEPKPLGSNSLLVVDTGGLSELSLDRLHRNILSYKEEEMSILEIYYPSNHDILIDPTAICIDCSGAISNQIKAIDFKMYNLKKGN